MPGRYVLKKASNGQYYFLLKAGNGETVAQSEMYTTKSGAKNGVQSVRDNAPAQTVDDETGE